MKTKKDILELAKDIIEDALNGSGCVSNYMAYSFLNRYALLEEKRCEVFAVRDDSGDLYGYEKRPHKVNFNGKRMWFSDGETMEGFEHFFPDGEFKEVGTADPVKYEIIIRKVED